MTLIAILNETNGTPTLEFAQPVLGDADRGFVCDDGRVAIFNNTGTCHTIRAEPSGDHNAPVEALVPSRRTLWVPIDADADGVDVQVDSEPIASFAVNNRSNILHVFVDLDDQISTMSPCCYASTGEIVVVNGCCDRTLRVGDQLQPLGPGDSRTISTPPSMLTITDLPTPATTLELTVVDQRSSLIRVTEGPLLLEVSSHVAEPDASGCVQISNQTQGCLVLEYGGVCDCIEAQTTKSLAIDQAAKHQQLISLRDDDPDPKVIIKHTKGYASQGEGEHA